jgi:superfamily I DNA/RNA helicase
MSLPEPKGRQREVVYLPEHGHTVVLGTAGSGKTTMAILRAQYLAALTSQKVLLVTFNRALVTYLKALAAHQQLPSLVTVENYHLFARGYLGSRGLMKYYDIADSDLRQRLIEQALNDLHSSLDGSRLQDMPAQFFMEESKWIAGCAIENSADYVALRQGMEGISWEESECDMILNIHQHYLYLREKQGYRYDWDDLALAVEKALIQDNTARRYQHIVIDEGQDFTPAMLRSLAQAIPPDGSLTFFGDMAQQIYGNRISWRAAGLEPAGILEFRENYRNSSEIAALALAMTRTPAFRDVIDLVMPNDVRAQGLPPTLVHCRSLQHERKLIIEKAEEALQRQQSVAILVRKHRSKSYYLEYFSQSQQIDRDLEDWSPNGISIGTYHAAKGLEFDVVLLPRCEAALIPDPERLQAFRDQDEALAQEARLVYVAITRARVRLILTYIDTRTKLLPDDMTLYKELEDE